MASDGTSANATNSPPLDHSSMLWEGDRMFHIYIYDYCMKRGFHKTANELMAEAGLPPQAQPPINAKQGLLFEWWSVFWVLFTAKSNGTGSEDALTYIQAASQSAAQKQVRPAPQPPRYANGARPPTQNGPQVNGLGPQVPQPPGAGMPNGAPGAVPFPGNAPQANGVPGTSAGPPNSAPPPPQPNGPHMVQGQRPPPQRGVNGAQFQSPTMAHSPPNPQGGPQHPNAAGGIGPVGVNPPLTQMNTQMNRGNMPPPSGPTGPGPMGNSQHTPQPAYQQLVGRSPSNPGSPASAMTARSPSLAQRQVAPLDLLNAEINRMPPPALQKIKQDMGLGEKDVNNFSIEEKQQLVSLFRRSNNMKPPNMAGPSAGPSNQSGPSPMQHPAGLRTPQMAPNAHPQGQQGMQPQQGQNQQQRGAKRNSTSPGQEAEQLPRNESSPPDRKRARRSPGGEQSQQPVMTPMYPPPQPGGPPMQPGPHMPPNGLVRGGMQMPHFNGPPMAGMGNPMMGPPMGTPQMSPMNQGMGAAMMGAPPAGMSNAQLQQYRQAMQNIHNKHPHMQQMHPGGVASPSASGSQGPDGSEQQRQAMQYMAGGAPPGGRMVQNKPMGGMLPPPSPAMAAKQPGGPQKLDGSDGPGANGHLDRSPQNAALTAGGQQQQQQQQQSQQQPQQQPHQGQPPQQGGPAGPPPVGTPAPATPNNSSMTAPSPQAIMGNSTPSMNHPPPPPPPQPAPSASDGLDPTGFGNIDFGASLGDFDPSNIDFATDTSLNFERDFAEWFNPENTNGP